VTRPSPIQIGCGVVVKKGPLFLVGERKGSQGAGLWALPGGKPDPGETPLEAAKRELWEETGITGKDWRELPAWTYDPFPERNLYFVTLYFECYTDSWVDEQPIVKEPEKCAGWQWVHFGQIPADKRFVGLNELYHARHIN
jgi:8-oxo-dGTP diphosphatase